MSAQRANAPWLEHPSELRRSWMHNLFECNHCGCQVCILHPVGFDPVAKKLVCMICDHDAFSDFDGIGRDWRRLH